MAALKGFFFNLLCTALNFLCQVDNPYPEIRQDGRREGALETNPIVETSVGKVRGYLQSSTEGKVIYTFESIPYATPPINGLRFQPPVPVRKWNHIVEATRLPPMCLQVNPSQLFRTVGQEDCLYLNIYTPKIPGNGNGSDVPVVVWIHGGAFSFGYSGDYGPAYLLNKEVVLVTLNYRVGILGFLSTGDSICPGNNGLKDQALALKWVYENIKSFGGDINRITLAGQSAGGVSTHLHMMSQASQPYFQAAVSMSGTAFVHWAVKTPEETKRLVIKMSEIHGCGAGLTSSEILGCFLRQNPVFLVSSQLMLQDWTPFPAVLFAPVVEGASNSSFLTAQPQTLYAMNQVSKVPWITSSTSQEGYVILLFLKGLLKLRSFRNNWYQLAPLALNYKYSVTDFPDKVTSKITDYYLKNKSPADATLDELSEIFSDRYFTFGFIEGLRQHSKISRNTYGYLWKYKGRYNIANSIGVESSNWGVGHGEDMFYLLNSTSSYHGFALSDSEYVISQILVDIMFNFFAQREPLYDTPNGTKEVVWTPAITNASSSTPQGSMMGAERIELLQFDHDIKMVPSPFEKRVEFWLSLNLSDTKSWQ